MRNRLAKCRLETVPEEYAEDADIEDRTTKEHIRPTNCIVSLRNGLSCTQDVPIANPIDIGTFGTVNIEDSQDVHFGHKIFAAPITIVNKIGNDDDHAIQGSFADVITRSTDFFKSRYYLRYRHITARQRATCAVCGVCFITAVATCIVILVIMTNWNKFTESPELVLNQTWFVSRDEWQALDPRKRTLLKLPVKMVVVAHTAMTSCHTRRDCIEEVREIQAEHMTKRRMNDIAYNYLIGGGGLLVQGCGSNAQGTHTLPYEDRSLAFAFIGNYQLEHPDDSQLENLRYTFEELVRNDKLDKNYWLVAACKITGIGSPGSNLVDVLKNWPHWVENFSDIVDAIN